MKDDMAAGVPGSGNDLEGALADGDLALGQPVVRQRPLELVDLCVLEMVFDEVGEPVGTEQAKSFHLLLEGLAARLTQDLERVPFALAERDAHPELLAQRDGLLVVVAVDVSDEEP